MKSRAMSDRLKNYDYNVIRTSEISPGDLETIHDLFELNYMQANHAYLLKSFEKLRFIALAYDRAKPIGFALADAVDLAVPGMTGTQCVILAGICCISPEYRRQGLFNHLELKAVTKSGVLETADRALLCGRMAHPASFRIISRNPTVVPKPGVFPSEWHKKVGLFVAGLYGVDLDPETFVVRGSGTPIGYPKLEIQVEEEEWLCFKQVNRDHGDSLLGIAWTPDAPYGW